MAEVDKLRVTTAIGLHVRDAHREGYQTRVTTEWAAGPNGDMTLQTSGATSYAAPEDGRVAAQVVSMGLGEAGHVMNTPQTALDAAHLALRGRAG